MPGPMVPRPMTAALLMMRSARRRLLEGSLLFELVAPGAEIGERRELDWEVEAAMEHRPQRDIGQAKLVAGDEGFARDRLVQDLELRAQFLGVGGEGCRALVLGLFRILEDLHI